MKIERSTKETRIRLELGGTSETIRTPDPFFSHMLSALSRHGELGLQVDAKSLDGDSHHLVEDVAITLGMALGRLAQERPRARFGQAVVPMDDALVACYLDLSGRGYYEGRLPRAMDEHVFRSLAFEARATLHVEVLRGREEHHVSEAAYKALGRCLKQALEPAPETASTKGKVRTRGG